MYVMGRTGVPYAIGERYSEYLLGGIVVTNSYILTVPVNDTLQGMYQDTILSLKTRFTIKPSYPGDPVYDMEVHETDYLRARATQFMTTFTTFYNIRASVADVKIVGSSPRMPFFEVLEPTRLIEKVFGICRRLKMAPNTDRLAFLAMFDRLGVWRYLYVYNKYGIL